MEKTGKKIKENPMAVKKIRLDKLLTQTGLGSRSAVKVYLRKGRIEVNGRRVKDPAMKIDSEKDKVFFDGQALVYTAFEYIMLHKPAGLVSATRDDRYTTVMDLVKNSVRQDLFPVGRLDKDTEGLLLLTNDGDLAHRLLSPAKHVDKQYLAFLDGPLTDTIVRAFAEGLSIGDEKDTLPAEVGVLGEDPTQVLVTIREGRFHQIKRMFAACDRQVLYLKRLSMGPLVLDPALAVGDYRPLTDKEKEELALWH